MKFNQVSYENLKRHQKYLCDDGFNMYIGIFAKYENNHALFEKTQDVTILDTIETTDNNDSVVIHYNRYSKYYPFYKWLSLFLCVPTIGYMNRYFFTIFYISNLTYFALTAYEITRNRRMNPTRIITTALISIMGHAVNIVHQPGIIKECAMNCYIYFYMNHIANIEYGDKQTSFYMIHKTKQKEMETRVFNKIMFDLFGCEVNVGRYL